MLSSWLGENDFNRGFFEQDSPEMSVQSILSLAGELITVQRPDDTVTGFTTIIPQRVFITQRGTGEVYGELRHTTTITSEKIVVVLGDLHLDIEVNDRFLYRGQYYQVHMVDKSYSERVEAYAKTQD